MNSLNFLNVDRLCASVDLSQARPVIDLSSVDFFEPFALIYLGMFLRHQNANGKALDVALPRNRGARAYVTRQNFWARFNFDPAALPPELLHRVHSTSSLDDIVDIERRPGVADEIAEAVIDILAYNGVPLQLGVVGEIVSELVENFALHAEGPLAAFMMQCYRNRFAFALGDCGIGIRASLSQNPDFAYLAQRPHREAAAKAFEPRVSRRRDAGTGLSEVRESTAQMRGSLRLVTGDGYVRMFGRQAPRSGNQLFHLPGVQVEVSIPIVNGR